MSFWKLFTKDRQDELPKIQLGRFSESYKQESQNKAWDQSIADFEQEQYEKSILSVLEYMMNEERNNIVINQSNGNEIKASLIQGSIKLTLEINKEQFLSYTTLAHVTDPSVGMLRRLLEQNYAFQYSRYFIDENGNLGLIFDCTLEESNPYRIFYGLKEIAIHADQLDDSLIAEFEGLRELHPELKFPLTDQERNAKKSYFFSESKRVAAIESLGSLKMDRFPGAYSYLYLSTLYKFDFFLIPEGQIMKKIQIAQADYHSEQTNDVGKKVKLLKQVIVDFSNFDESAFEQELYQVNSTFALTKPNTKENLQKFIQSEIQSMEWYVSNNHLEVCECICSYVGGYILFHFSLKEYSIDLLTMLYQITDSEFFNTVGIHTKWWKQNDIDKGIFESEIKEILSHVQQSELNVNLKQLDWTNRIQFLRSFLHFISLYLE